MFPSLDPAEFGWIGDLVDRALAEDLASGDATARAVVSAGTRAAARLVARGRCVLAGAAVFSAVFRRLHPEVEVAFSVEDGAAVEPGTALARVQGPARPILAGERTALNLLQRACGVATATRRYVEAAGGIRVADTRKTMPGLRALDRYAVRCGGGYNHRNDAGAAVLIKENHVRLAGGIAAAVRRAKAAAGHMQRVACEVTTLAELEAALDAGADVVLLDNMDDAAVAAAVKRARGRAVIEVSGGLTPERLPRLARLGVDVVSVGAITHSAPAADLSLLVDLQPGA